MLLHHRFLIPQWYGPSYRVAYTDKFERPETMPDNDLGFAFWWVDPEREAALASR